MPARKSRRNFLGLIGAGATATALAAAGVAAADAPKNAKGDKKMYAARRTKGSLEEALDLAVEAAVKDAPGADALVTWTLVQVKGRQGSATGVSEVMVAIEASVG